MVRRTNKTDANSEADTDAGAASPFSRTVRESASQIWLAGLGAFAKAQEEGSKAFDALVREGLDIQRRTQARAEEKFSDAGGRMASMASGISSRATGQWDKLENLFEARVLKALDRLGVPSADEFDALAARVEELERQLGSQAQDSDVSPRPSSRTADDSADHSTPRNSTRRSV